MSLTSQIEECRSLAHKVFRLKWDNPASSLKQIAHDLHATYSATSRAWERLRKREDFPRLCPICFEAKRYGLICHHCGAELDQAMPLAVDFDSQSPRHSIQPKNGLGSETDYYHLRFLTNSGRVVKNQAEIDRTRDNALERSKSDLLQWLKGSTPKADVTEAAARLLAKEFNEFHTRYPGLKATPKIRVQLLSNAKRRLILAFPSVELSNSNGGSGEP